jgi:hypothetical protein
MKKVTDAELEQIRNLKSTLMDIVTTAGELSINEFVIESQLKSLKAEIEVNQGRFTEFQQKERVLFEELQKKYGPGNIDTDTGEITE